MKYINNKNNANELLGAMDGFLKAAQQQNPYVSKQNINTYNTDSIIGVIEGMDKSHVDHLHENDLKLFSKRSILYQ